MISFGSAIFLVGVLLIGWGSNEVIDKMFGDNAKYVKMLIGFLLIALIVFGLPRL